jgi:hypothetical protein
VKRLGIVMIALGALGAAACGGKKDEPQPTVATGSAVGMAAGSAAEGDAGTGTGSAEGMAAGSADPGAEDEVDVPTDVDFETEAAAKIDEKNVEAQLKAIEQELAQ